MGRKFPLRNYHIKKVANIQLSELRKYDWWRLYEAGPKCRPRAPVIRQLKELFPQWANDPTFNFHWDKNRQFAKLKLYIHVPKVKTVEIQHEQRQSEVPPISDAVLRNTDLLG